jgi:ferredoxin-NADP reductase
MNEIPAERELLVRSLVWEAEGVLGVELVDPAGAPLPGWEPGAHLDLLLPVGSQPLSRQYSLCGDPADRSRYEIGVLLEPDGRGGSAFVHSGLRPGARVAVRGPRNHFRLEPAPAYLFIAGGIGITPLLPMVAAADAVGATWSLLYGGRTAASMAYRRRLLGFGGHVTLCPQDVDGLLDLDSVLAVPSPGTLVYCCGPEGLIAAVEKLCSAWPQGSLHTERFAAPEQPVRDPADELAIELVLSRSGRRVLVRPECSVLDALRDSGVEVLSDCRDGICGTCEVGVLEGEVEHRDFILTDSERAANQFMMVCVSRARSDRLVLDL